MKNYRIGIVGPGKVAHLHAKAIREIPQARLTGVCARTPGKAKSFAEEYGAHPFTAVKEMVESAGTDMVIVCTPHPAHLDPTMEALQAGAHVLVEKPLASSLADCDRMIRTARENGRKLGVISQRRWYPPVQRVKRAIEEGKIGKPVLATVQMLGWRDEKYYRSDPWRGTWALEGGGVMVNQAPHQLDLLNWFMGPVEEVYGLAANLNHPYIEVEDTALAIVKFRSGALGNIILSNSQKPGLFGKVHVHGENGASVGVQPEGGAMFIAGMTGVSEPPVIDLWTIPGEEKLLNKFVEEDKKMFAAIDPTIYFIRLQIEDYLQALDQNREPLVNGEEGRRTVELFTAIYRSTRDHKPIQFPLQPEEGREDYDGRPGIGRKNVKS